MACTTERTTPEMTGLPAFPVAASTKIYKGSLVALNAGYAVPASTATGLVALGRARDTVDNSAGLAGAKSVEVDPGTFRWANSSSTDEITQAEVGSDCYIVDDQTVAKTSGTNTRSVAGKVVAVDAIGVYVKSGL